MRYATDVAMASCVSDQPLIGRWVSFDEQLCTVPYIYKVPKRRNFYPPEVTAVPFSCTYAQYGTYIPRRLSQHIPAVSYMTHSVHAIYIIVLGGLPRMKMEVHMHVLQRVSKDQTVDCSD